MPNFVFLGYIENPLKNDSIFMFNGILLEIIGEFLGGGILSHPVFGVFFFIICLSKWWKNKPLCFPPPAYFFHHQRWRKIRETKETNKENNGVFNITNSNSIPNQDAVNNLSGNPENNFGTIRSWYTEHASTRYWL